MKKITEMTDREILALTDDDISRMVKLRMAEEGIRIIDEPKKPELAEIKPGDIIAWTVEGFSHNFIRREDADKAAEFISELKPRLMDDTYERHYSLKKLKEPYNPEGIGLIQPKRFYSDMLIREIEEQVDTNGRLKEAYDTQYKEYSEHYERAQYIRDEIHERCHEVREKNFNMERMKQKYGEYLDLAGGDKELALKFLKKAYAIDGETENFITERETEQMEENHV